MKGLIDKRITNPETKNKILVKTALGYAPNHPARREAEKIVNQAKKKNG